MIRSASWWMASLATIACVTLSGSAHASPIDNPGLNCKFEFYKNGGTPFLDFSNGKSTTGLAGTNSFSADTDSAGNMSFVGSTMQLELTDALVNGVAVRVRLLFTDVVGTTDLSGADPDINWEMTAKLQVAEAGQGITTVNCQTGTFTIYVSGDWGNTTSSTFTIPAMSGSGSGACNGLSAAVNTALGLGTNGATLSLYKFRAYNGTTPLSGS
ncbi:hypothetical protein [Polyangium fumosum]|uniref:Uncharacterized protein n=1 Tax=Polyangium fumosum TaxID=889272 RepID=A0A4V5PKJ7_9BACT|nr:hypothetical protein [Polyangium fumosum]TKC95848.1 hypothetical protein E8A74_46290 [Polyangium fumosum]